MSQNIDVVKRALLHYSKGLERFSIDDVQLANGFVEKDILTLSRKAKDIAAELDDYKSTNTFKDYRDLIKTSLLFYVKDLENSKKMVIQKLEAGMDIQFVNVDDEIRLAKNVNI